MTENTRTLVYDDKTYGRKIIALPPVMPFLDLLGELLDHSPKGEMRDNLLKLATIENIFKQADALGDYIATSSEPHREILRIAAIAAEGETAGLVLLYALLVALPPAETMVAELADFTNVRRVMARIERQAKAGIALKESEEWFNKKVLLLTTSHPLPGSSAEPVDKPWLGWSEGVRRALSDPDRRWDKAIMERAKAELEALDLRIKRRLADINFMNKEKSTIFLITKADETRWYLQALEGAYQRYGQATLVVRQKLGDRWDSTVAALRESSAGSAIADLLDMQLAKVHTYPNMKLGTSVIRALLAHPLLIRTQRKPDNLSCLAIFVESAGGGIFEVLLQKVAAVNVLKTLLDLPGFEIREKILRIELAKVPPAHFIDIDNMPREVDWTNIHSEQVVSYRSLVMTYLDNDNFIVELLNNPRVLAQPGIMSLIALRSRSMRVLTIIANRRDLYTGFANKEVPVNILQNPAKVPLSSLRKFIHVRFIDKATLARFAGKGSQMREEVRREIQKYLSNLN
jgi:hypothetical protein